MRQRPLLFRLAGCQVADDFPLRQEFLSSGGQGRVGVNFRFERTGGDVPRGKQMHHPRRLVLQFVFPHHALVVAKSAAKKSAALRPAEPPARADQKTQDGAAIIAGEIHRAVEAFAAQRADHRPGLAQARASAPARHRPDAVEPRQMLEQRRDFLRHQQMQFTVRTVAANRPQRRGHQHRVAEVFELEGENFFGPRAHGAN